MLLLPPLGTLCRSPDLGAMCQECVHARVSLLVPEYVPTHALLEDDWC